MLPSRVGMSISSSVFRVDLVDQHLGIPVWNSLATIHVSDVARILVMGGRVYFFHNRSGTINK
jgi:hypothetical protein